MDRTRQIFKQQSWFGIILAGLVCISVLPTVLGMFEPRVDSFGSNSHMMNMFQPRFAAVDYNKNTTEITNTWRTGQWMANPSFDGSGTPWTMKSDGDATDIIGTVADGTAKTKVVGDQNTTSIIAKPPSAVNWTAMKNPAFPAYPEWNTPTWHDSYGFDSAGCWANHSWQETARQAPSINWVQNITMPKNMSDYIITSANVSAVINASVSSNVDVLSTTLDPPEGPNTANPQGVTFDYVRFYVRIADLDRENTYDIAYNRTKYLGWYNPAIPASVLTMSDTYMTPVSEQNLIFFLTSVLSKDNFNFSLILGLDFWCEDSCSSDRDDWNMIRIKSLNLTFTYEKQINQNTDLGWEQAGAMITGTNTTIMEGRLYFKYAVDSNWPDASPNSEIREFLNGNAHSESIKLSRATTQFQNASDKGFDVTPLIQKGVNITLAIQVFLADQFTLQQNVSVFLDDVRLVITYVVTEVHPSPNNDNTILVYVLIAAMGALVTLFAAYQFVWKYPPYIRQLRMLKRSVRKGNVKDIQMRPLDSSLADEYIRQAKDGLSGSQQEHLKAVYIKPPKTSLVNRDLTGIEKPPVLHATSPPPIQPTPASPVTPTPIPPQSPPEEPRKETLKPNEARITPTPEPSKVSVPPAPPAPTSSHTIPTLKPDLPAIKPIPERFLELIKNKPTVKPLPSTKQPPVEPPKEKSASQGTEKKEPSS